MNCLILKALTARGEVTRVQGNREESTPPFRELQILISESKIRTQIHAPPFRELKQIFEIQCQITGQHLSKLKKTPVKLSSLVALHGEHVGEEFVA